MGRKKGKQRGVYASKAKKAQYLHELNQQVTDIHQEYRNAKTSEIKSNQLSQLQKFQNERRGGVSTSILRGIIRERLFEDRERDAIYRRQMMTASIASNSHQKMKRYLKKHNCAKEGMVKPIGWSLLYDHREAVAGIEQPNDEFCKMFLEQQYECSHDQKGENILDSLQMICIYTLSTYLQQYIDACGEEYIVERLSLLPSRVITALSINCKNITDQIIYVLTKQLHVEALAFHGSIPSETHDYEMKPSERSNQYFTGAGFFLLNKEYSLDIEESSTAIYSWEEYQDLDKNDFIDNYNTIFATKKLKRLELRNIHPKQTIHILSYLHQNPQLTHLCISESFNAISGPQILFCDENGRYEEDDDPDFCDGLTIPYYLEKLQFLDLSGCSWVSYDLLYLFLRRIKSQMKRFHSSLEMIVIGQYCSCLSDDQIAILNRLTGGKPYLCKAPP